MTSSEAIFVFVGKDFPARPSRLREAPKPPLVMSRHWNSDPSSRGPKKLSLGAGLPGFRGHCIRHCLCERAEHDRHDHVSDTAAAVTRRGSGGIDERASGAFIVMGR